MKSKKIYVTYASLLISAQAFAHAPNVFPDEVLYISGSSSQDIALESLVGKLCKPGTLDTFKDAGYWVITNPAKKGRSYTSYFCTINSSLVNGMSADKKVLINKRSAGGSGKGVQVVADGVAIEAMNINNDNCTDNGDTTWDCSIAGGIAGGDLFMKVSTAGISDVEPAMFVGLNVPPGDAAVTSVQISKMNIISMNALIFGVPVTENLYRALQMAQGLDTAKDDEANMPSLSTSQIYSLIAGGIATWDQLIINSIPLTKVAGVIPPTNDSFGSFTVYDSLVHYCRRPPGSGAQAQMNAKFANAPCSGGVVAPRGVNSTNPLFGPVVQENSSSSDLTVCMQDKFAAGKWAIGVQSLEKSDASFRFIKIDGVAPTLKNVAQNKYKDWVETTIQWRNTTNSGPAGDALAILQTIAKDASTPETIAYINYFVAQQSGKLFDYSTGTYYYFDPYRNYTKVAISYSGAYLALNTNGYKPTFPHDDTNPVTTATHAPMGTQNTCNTPFVNINSTL